MAKEDHLDRDVPSVYETEYGVISVKYVEELIRDELPYRIFVDASQIPELVDSSGLVSFRDGVVTVDHESDYYNQMSGKLTYGVLESEEPWHPLRIRIFGLRSYQDYMNYRLQMSKDDALQRTRTQIARTITHETAHYQLRRGPFVTMAVTMLPSLSRQARSLQQTNPIWTEEEVLCEVVASRITDAAANKCVSFVVKE